MRILGPQTIGATFVLRVVPLTGVRLALVRLATCLLLSVGVVGSAHATPTEELQAARESFRAGDYDAAIGKFSALLYPTSRLARASSIAEAHLLLGVCFFETGRKDSAEREFEEALFLDDSLTLSDTLFSNDAIAFFSVVLSKQQKSAVDAAEKERLARKKQALNRAFQNLVVLEKRRYWVNIMPFGAGQFQNGDTKKGTAFFVAEALTGGATVGIWSYQVIKYGFGGRVPRDEIDTVNTLQIIQIGAGAAFWGILAWGIIDSLANYEHAVKREADPSLLKDLEKIFENESSGVSLVPLIGPETQGVSLAWEF